MGRSRERFTMGEITPVILSLILLSFLAACQSESDSQKPPELTQVWTWMSGSQTRNQVGIYGTKGVAAPANVPGARYTAMSWADPSGKLWLFGGQGPDATGFFSVLNDLWTFDPASSQWTWVSGSREGYQSGSYGTKGVAAATNVPGARYMAVTWIDSGGRLWLFGGVGIAESAEEGGELNDLWRFDPATSLWTWVAGSRGVLQQAVYGIKGVADPANVPGARSEAVSWIDPQDRLWLFGGRGYNAVEPMNVDLNDLWRFDPATLEWIWLSGNEEGNALGVYGTKGQSDPANVPGGRGGSVSWIDSQGKLWLLGGSGWGTSYEDNIILLNDLWRFDPATLEWTWVHGGNSGEQPGVYGTKGLAALTNTPGSRTLSVSWRDPQGKLWLFGGSGFNAAGQWSDLNDLWRFDPETLEWAWISGSEIGDQIGLYGEKGTPAPANVPGPHTSAVSWCCPHGRLWLFGGHGLDAAGDYGDLNDLWRYTR